MEGNDKKYILLFILEDLLKLITCLMITGFYSEGRKMCRNVDP